MRPFLPVLLLLAPPALAQSQLHYAGYAGVAEVIRVTASYDVTGPTYHVALNYRTAGPAALLFPGGTDSVVDGHIVNGHPRPARLFSSGALRGQPRVTQIEYVNEMPVIRQMQPGQDPGREPVPAAQQAHTVDGLSAMADLVHRVVTTGRCEGEVRTYDGRRLSEIEARTAGTDLLPPTPRSSFSGPALHCAITSRFVAGFMPDTEAQVRKPQQASAWFAPIVPGGPPVPVRITIPTRFVGEASLYLTE